MKKITAIILSLAFPLSLVACNNKTNPNKVHGDSITPVVPYTEPSDKTISSFSVNIDNIKTLNELEVRIDEHLTNNIETLISHWESLSTEIDTYEKYCEQSETVSKFYQTIVRETEQMCIMLYEYSSIYARMILDSDMSNEDKYDAVDGIHDCLYEDACDKIHDEIYEELLDEMHDYFYEGILDDNEDDVDYSDWYDVCSEEYNQWYDTSSEVYNLYYDTASDIYSFYSNMSSKLYNSDFDRAEKLYEKFLQKTARAKGLDSEDSFPNATFDTTLREINSIEDFESVVDSHVSECVQALKNEWKGLSTSIDTFDKYTNNIDAIDEFHTHIENSAEQILVMICNYGVSYSEIILQSNSSANDKYEDFESFKDCIYEDACAIVKEEIYEDLLNEIKDYYYDGIINDEKDSIEYSEWSDFRSDAYGLWIDTRGEVYGSWIDVRGDLYSFYSDILSELYNGDFDGANNELQDFKKKVDKMT